MEPRTHESPMDFEWQNPPPGDPTSPFQILSENARQNELHGKKRTHNVFESPVKPQPPTSAFQNFSFSTPSAARPLPNAFLGNPSFTTPRKSDIDVFSSGAETSSPYNAEAEETPEAPAKGGTIRGTTAMTLFAGAVPDGKSTLGLSKKSGKWWNASPGRGEVRRGKYPDTIGRVRKRPRVGGDRENRFGSHYDGYDSGDSSDENINRPRYGRRDFAGDKKTGGVSHNPIGSFFSWMEAHPGLPHVLISYFQLFWNILIVFYILHLAYGFVSAIRADVSKKSNEATADILVEIAACAQQFVDNKCDRDKRVPAMENVCNSWEKCMNRDPQEVGYAKVSAHTFAEIFNSLIEPISYKSMFFMVVMTFGFVAISNFGIIQMRNKTVPPPQYMHPAPSTQRHPSESQYPPFNSHIGGSSMALTAGEMSKRQLSFH